MPNYYSFRSKLGKLRRNYPSFKNSLSL